MLLLTSTSDLVRVITGSAGAVNCHASYMDNASGVITPGRTNTAQITTAATTTVCGSPGVSTQRNLKFLSIANTHASVSNAIQVQHYDGTTAEQLWDGTLLPGENVVMDETGNFVKYTASGIAYTAGLPLTTKGDLLGFDTTPNRIPVGTDMQVLTAAASAALGVKWASPYLSNRSTSTVSAGYAADTYLAGSSIAMPAGGPVVGTRFRCIFDMTKTGAGVAAFTVNVRYGTAGAVGDASICALAFAVGTAVIDSGTFELNGHFRSVGSGTSAVFVGLITCSHALAATGLITTGAAGFGQVITVGGGFNSTPAGSILGVSVNGGASFSGTCTLVETECFNLSI